MPDRLSISTAGKSLHSTLFNASGVPPLLLVPSQDSAKSRLLIENFTALLD
jgi:hypothetical protein